MNPPPEWLIGWTDYLIKVIGALAAILALYQGGNALRWKAERLKRDGRGPIMPTHEGAS